MPDELVRQPVGHEAGESRLPDLSIPAELLCGEASSRHEMEVHRDIFYKQLGIADPLRPAELSESIAELTRMNFRVGFYPFPPSTHIAYFVNIYGDESRMLYGTVSPEKLPQRMAWIVDALKAGKFDELVKVTIYLTHRPPLLKLGS